MNNLVGSRRDFLRTTGFAAGSCLLSPAFSTSAATTLDIPEQAASDAPVGYILRIRASTIEIAPKRIVSVVTYNGQFSGPCCGSGKGSMLPSEFSMKPTHPSSCTGTARIFPLRSMAQPKKAPHTFQLTECGALFSPRILLGSAFTIPATARAPISPPASTAA